MTPCERFEARISEWYDGELSAAAAADCEQHRRACAPCRKLWEEMSAGVGLLRDPVLLAPPAGAGARLRLWLERELPAATADAATAPRAGFWAPWLAWLPAWRMLAAAAALLVVAGGVFQLRGAPVVASGWLTDDHCYAKFCTHPADHTRTCMLGARCSLSAFGLIDEHGKFLPFDHRGTQSAQAALRNGPEDHIWATVHARKGFTSVLRVEQINLTRAPDSALAGAPHPVQLALNR